MRSKCDNYIHNVLSDELIIGYFPYCNIWDNCSDFKPLKK